jgi:isopropylmalate/homocitrate/citramalate synthase
LGQYPIADNRAVSGERLFHVESGIITDWWHNVGEEHILEVFPYRHDLVGQPPPELVLGKLSSTASIIMALDQRGITASEGQIADMLLRVKQRAIEKKAELNNREFDEIVARVLDPDSRVLVQS